MPAGLGEDVRFRRHKATSSLHIPPMQIDETACHAAVDAKDRRYDGLIYIGVTSTDNGAHPRSRPT